MLRIWFSDYRSYVSGIVDFESLNLCQPLLKALDEIGYVTPTPIQEQAIPLLIEGNDMLGCAQTGTVRPQLFHYRF